jgi:NADPH:quinone reductase-like Zn-dependent oxidoreductase
MKAVVYTEYGPPEVLQLTQVEKPIPKENEILIKVHATSICYGDLVVRKFGKISPREFHMPLPFWLLGRTSLGFNKPRRRILGHEFAGEIEAVGKAVHLFSPGDQVFGHLGQRMGADAEYVCMPEEGMVVRKPTNMTYEEAAVLPYGAFTALNLLRNVEIQPGQKILINGASGGIGSAAVQLAKHYGAEVTGVCGTPRLDFVRALGADKVIDYTAEDFTQNGETYDIIIDVLGKSSFSRCKNSLTDNGRYLLVSFKSRDLLDMLWTSIAGSKRVICALAPEKPEDLAQIKELIEAGVIKAVIDRRFPLEQVAEAHRYVEDGHKKGHIAIIVSPNGKN